MPEVSTVFSPSLAMPTARLLCTRDRFRWYGSPVVQVASVVGGSQDRRPLVARTKGIQYGQPSFMKAPTGRLEWSSSSSPASSHFPAPIAGEPQQCAASTVLGSVLPRVQRSRSVHLSLRQPRHQRISEFMMPCSTARRVSPPNAFGSPPTEGNGKLVVDNSQMLCPNLIVACGVPQTVLASAGEWGAGGRFVVKGDVNDRYRSSNAAGARRS